MQVLEVFESTVNSDGIEGRGHNVHVGYFTHECDALRSVRGKGVMGVGDGNVHKVKLTIFEDLEEFSKLETENLRTSALAKLTDEEIEALGLK